MSDILRDYDRARVRRAGLHAARTRLLSRSEDMEHSAAEVQRIADTLAQRHPNCPAHRDAVNALEAIAADLNGEANPPKAEHEETPIADRVDRLHDDRVSDRLLARPA